MIRKLSEMPWKRQVDKWARTWSSSGWMRPCRRQSTWKSPGWSWSQRISFRWCGTASTAELSSTSRSVRRRSTEFTAACLCTALGSTRWSKSVYSMRPTSTLCWPMFGRSSPSSWSTAARRTTGCWLLRLRCSFKRKSKIYMSRDACKLLNTIRMKSSLSRS